MAMTAGLSLVSVATISYTTDGSTPTTGSAQYSSPIPVAGRPDDSCGVGRGARGSVGGRGNGQASRESV